MYATFKIEGDDCRLSSILSEGKVYEVPPRYRVCLNPGLHGYDINIKDIIKDVKEKVDREERLKEVSSIERSKEFKETFGRLYIEKFKRVFAYMKGYDSLIKEAEDSGDIGLINGMLSTLFVDLIEEGFQYYRRDENGDVINPYVEDDPIDMKKLHNELNRI